MVSTPTRSRGKEPDAGDSGSQRTSVQRTKAKQPVRLRGHVRKFWEALEGRSKAPNSSTYYLILGCAMALTAIGVMMVLSASSVEAISEGKSPYADALKQAAFGVMGLIAMYVISRTNVNWMKRLSWWGFGIVVVLLVLVQVIGNSVNGNRNWVDIGGITIQPSEIAKLALCVWIAAVLARKEKYLTSWWHVIIPVIPGAGLVIVLVMLGNDLGTVIVIAAIMVAALYFAGVPARMLAIVGLIGAAGATAGTLSSANRICRITSWLGNPSATCTEQFDFDFQSTNGMYGLAQGSWTGLGLGQSRQKYNWLPEAHNDFIFAIIGEEAGLGWHPCGVGPVRNPRYCHFPGCGPPNGSVPAHAGRRHHGVVARPGQHEYGCCHPASARDRRPAALHLLWRFSPGDVTVRRRRSVVSGPGTTAPAATPRIHSRSISQSRTKAYPHFMTADSHQAITPLSVVLAGGGTAGHISPLLAIADAIRSQRPDAAILAVGTPSGMETRLIPAAGYELATIDRVPFPRRPSMDLARLPGRLSAAVKQAGRILDDAAADVLVGVGGYVCTPMYLAARKRRIPIVIHEANLKAGLANRVGAVQQARRRRLRGNQVTRCPPRWHAHAQSHFRPGPDVRGARRQDCPWPGPGPPCVDCDRGILRRCQHQPLRCRGAACPRRCGDPDAAHHRRGQGCHG